MLNKLICIILLSQIFATFFIISCKTSQEEEKGGKPFKFISSKKGNNTDTIPSKDMIDMEPTYEIFFKLEKNVKCIDISVSSTYYTDKFTDKKTPRKTYFIIDRVIDVSRFKDKEKKYIFSEISKNFNSRWDLNERITICTLKNDPILKLDSSSLYRIRFTTFSPVKFEFKIDIHANCKVTFKNIQE